MDAVVKRAREVLDGITPGPWVAKSKPGDDEGFDGLRITAGGEKLVVSGCGCCGSPFGENVKDVPFFAAARSLVPEMADRIEALEAENARLRAEWANSELTHKLMESRDFEAARAERTEALLAEAVEALSDIAKQLKTDELVTEYDVEVADFEDGYDMCIDRARAILARIQEKDE